MRKTKFRRATVTQEMRPILEPMATKCMVQVLTPDSPIVALTADKPDEGANEIYAYPHMPPGNSIQFTLAPGQQLWAASVSGHAQVSLILEYPEDEE